MAKPVKPAKKKKSGNLLVHVVLLLLLATVGWRLYALQGQVRAAQAERDQYARQVENVQQENETLRSDIAEGPTEEKMKELGYTPAERRQVQKSAFIPCSVCFFLPASSALPSCCGGCLPSTCRFWWAGCLL